MGDPRTVSTFSVGRPASRADSGTWEARGWKVTTRKCPILNSEEIDRATERIGIPMPEMIFGNNAISIEHIESGLVISFNAMGALDQVDKTGEDGLLQVAHSKEWLRSRQNAPHGDVQGIIKPFDWTYTTAYRGDTMNDTWEARDDIRIPTEVLARPDPILFFDEVSLYEDELGDNGIVSMDAKIRVMPERLLLLCRFFLRVDDVLFRIRDTRVFVEFAEGIVIREYRAQEEKYHVVKGRVPIGVQDHGPNLRDANWVVKMLPITKVIREIISVGGTEL